MSYAVSMSNCHQLEWDDPVPLNHEVTNAQQLALHALQPEQRPKKQTGMFKMT